MATIDHTSHRVELAERIKRLRQEQGLSIRKFAAMIGISKTYLYHLETAQANPTLDVLERVGAGLGITASKLIDFGE